MLGAWSRSRNESLPRLHGGFSPTCLDFPGRHSWWLVPRESVPAAKQRQFNSALSHKFYLSSHVRRSQLASYTSSASEFGVLVRDLASSRTVEIKQKGYPVPIYGLYKHLCMLWPRHLHLHMHAYYTYIHVKRKKNNILAWCFFCPAHWST